MRKFLVCVFTLAALVFVTSGASAAVSLTQQQVKDQCGSQTDGKGYSYCQKSCAGGNTCEFGCGPKGCGGTCLTCKAAMQGTIIHNTIKAGAGALMAPSVGGTGTPSKGKTGLTPAVQSNPNLLQGGGAGTTTSSRIKLPGGSTGPTVPPTTGPTMPTR